MLGIDKDAIALENAYNETPAGSAAGAQAMREVLTRLQDRLPEVSGYLLCYLTDDIVRGSTARALYEYPWVLEEDAVSFARVVALLTIPHAAARAGECWTGAA